MDSGSHYMLPKDWRDEGEMSANLQIYGCKVEGPAGALSKLAGAKASLALFDCCRSSADPADVKGRSEAVLARGWEDKISTAGTGADNLMVVYGCGPNATAREGARHGLFTQAVLQVSAGPL